MDKDKTRLLSEQTRHSLQLVHTEILGRLVTFCAPDRQDPIVRNNLRGQFYEFAELEKLSRAVPKGSVIVDIGANIGNHSLFFALFLEASKIIPFEPNKEVYDILISNLIVNGVIDQFDFSCLGVGVSNERPAFIKIDVEGMELQALEGLSGLLEHCKPILMVEVDNDNYVPFMAWVESKDYVVATTHQRHKKNKNFILVDKHAEAELLDLLA